MTRRDLGALALGALLVPAAAAAQIGVTSPGNKHNLSATGPGPVKSSSETEICVFCHTPHNANPATPLWLHCGGGSIKSQMKKADRSGAELALIVGGDELAAGAVSVRELRAGEGADQQRVAAGMLADFLRQRLEAHSGH